MVMALNRVRNLSLAGVLIVVMQCLVPARAKVRRALPRAVGALRKMHSDPSRAISIH
jgi:hypothetical protein